MRTDAVGMLSRNWLPFTGGFAGFMAAHVVEAAKWTDWFRGQYRPWFLNSGRAVAFSVACVLAASAVTALRWDRPLAAGLPAAAGAISALIGVLLLSGDPGSIFPIVLAMGGVIVTAAAYAGTLMAAGVRALSR